MARKAELVRLAAPAARCESPASPRKPAHARRLVIVDAACRLPGRGAYLCRAADRNDLPDRECLRKALARKALHRAFRHSVELPVELVESVSR